MNKFNQFFPNNILVHLGRNAVAQHSEPSVARQGVHEYHNLKEEVKDINYVI
jgi:hypothetical protein